MPAIDVINLGENEKDLTKDFSLAFAASGDIRHVLKTVNSLPSDFTGNLDILINDGTPPVTSRNITLILILGLMHDEILAADVALHLWYSTFLPLEYHLPMSVFISLFLEHMASSRDAGPHENGSRFKLEGKSTLSALGCDVGKLMECFEHYITPPGISLEAAQSEYNRIRAAPPRQDFRDRMYAQLSPSHRAAFYEYQRFGIVLPFGAANAHFNCPNVSLFSSSGQWLQTDYADPLAGWDIVEVIEGGKKFGAQPEDIYGCLYLFLSDQLRTFYRRIRTFPISFKVFCAEATILATGISSGHLSQVGLPSSLRFDRIEVSNIVDAIYVGLSAVLSSYAPLLSPGKHSVIIAYFMNWFIQQKDARSRDAGEAVCKRLVKQMSARYMAKINHSLSGDEKIQALKAFFFTLHKNLDAFYENSKPFAEFLGKQGLSTVLTETKLQMRKDHKIVPHRLNVPLDAPVSALPDFGDDQTWYYYARVSDSTWIERFVEFSRE